MQFGNPTNSFTISAAVANNRNAVVLGDTPGWWRAGSPGGDGAKISGQNGSQYSEAVHVVRGNIWRELGPVRK